jgi:hypothetical protein
MYQVDGVQISFGIFPTGAFGNSAANPPTTTNAALFLAAANITYTGFQVDSCTSIGFKFGNNLIEHIDCNKRPPGRFLLTYKIASAKIT